jgi:hypothetical protein
MEEYMMNKTCAISQMRLFHHMTNRVARDHWKSDRSAPLQPSAWLDAVITCEQKALLAPTPADIVRASIINETIGEGAKKKNAKRRINFIDGNITSYSRLLNSSEQLTSMKEMNSLTAIIGEIISMRDQDKSERASAKAFKAQEREKRKQAAIQAEQEQKAALMPDLVGLAEAAVDDKTTLSNLLNSRLKDLLRYLFEPQTKGVSSMKRDKLMESVKNKLIAYKQNRATV